MTAATKIIVRLAVCVALSGLFGSSARTMEAAAPTAKAASVPGDRWMEIDLYWFDQNDLQQSVNTFWDRFAPLYQGIQGDKGVILNIGWTVSYIMEWSGDPNQIITLPQGTGQQPWVAETSSLPGSTEDRMREWKERFSKPIMVERKGYGKWTYADLARLANLLRADAQKRGISKFKVGSLVYAWDNAYGEVAPWAHRHPEAFSPLVRLNIRSYFNPVAALHADATRLGSLPQGISEGMPAHRVFASQWGSLSTAIGFDALMLRDSIGFPLPYGRRGPDGTLMPSPQAIQEATDGVSALVRETKQANPKSLLMMYSNAASAIGDWRCNGLDLERIAKEGSLDIFVDQTWAGAWNEVGTRNNSFWNDPFLGWTYQLSYTLLHGAMLAGTKVRHYPLIETFDAWESWDTLHTVPDRLRWGIWAYSHAAVITPHGVVMPGGSYISWANQGKRLLSEEDVRFLNDNISAAVKDAAQTTQVFGPTLVYSREAMQWQAGHATPNADIKEWIDQLAGTVAKWPVPILSVTRLEWLPDVHTDLAVVQTPFHVPASEVASLAKAIAAGRPMAIVGSFAEGVDPKLMTLAGEPAFQKAETVGRTRQAELGIAASSMKLENFPKTFPIEQLLDTSSAGVASQQSALNAVYSVEGTPQLLLVRDAGRQLVLWDPPESNTSKNRPLRQILGGSGEPYALAAASLNELLRNSGGLHAQTIDMDQTGAAAAWRTSDGMLHFLSGNVEEGLRDDADRSRHFTMELPSAWKRTQWHSVWATEGSSFKANGPSLAIRLSPDAAMLLEAPYRR